CARVRGVILIYFDYW
nr:immunoglobulin heavy chain junction region [Macaca mulatta]